MSLFRIRDCIDKCPDHTPRMRLLYDKLHRIPAENMREKKIHAFNFTSFEFVHRFHLRWMQAYCRQTKRHIVAYDEKSLEHRLA